MKNTTKLVRNIPDPTMQGIRYAQYRSGFDSCNETILAILALGVREYKRQAEHADKTRGDQ